MLDMSVDGAFFTKLKKLFIRPVPDFHLFYLLVQAREKYLSLKKGTRTDVATAVEDVSLL